MICVATSSGNQSVCLDRLNRRVAVLKEASENCQINNQSVDDVRVCECESSLVEQRIILNRYNTSGG